MEELPEVLLPEVEVSVPVEAVFPVVFEVVPVPAVEASVPVVLPVVPAAAAACAAFFFARDMKQFLAWGRGFFSETAAFHISAAVKNSGGTGRKYILSYLFLYFLTFFIFFPLY